ncbi:MAG: hypothetical protein JEZ09_17395 [Salinivirgaceae bacterium]|nr:hypothetical protein [Salinivirgaceae bacterium]
MNRILVVIIALLFSTSNLISQSNSYHLNPEKNLNQYLVEHWSTDNSLPTNSILHIYQSSKGYIWISSYGGIIRFDGHKFVNFNKKNTPVLQSDNIGRIAEDKQGNIWFTSQESGLIKYSKNKLEVFGIEEGIKNLYRAIYIGDNNKIWLASPDKGWMYFENNKFNILEYDKDLSKIEVRCINKNNSGKIYFGTLGDGLFIYNNGKLSNINSKNGLPSDWIYSIYFDRNDQMYLGTATGIYLYDGNSYKKLNSAINSTVNAITEDNYGNLWIASVIGLYRINKKTLKTDQLTTENGLHHNFINDLTFDFEGDLWLANYKGGVSRIKDGKFTNYTQKTGLNGKVVNAICELSENKYLLAFDNGMLNIIDHDISKPFFASPNIEGKRVRHILKDSKNNLWFSTYSGLLKLTAKNAETWYTSKSGFPDTKIRVSFEDSKGNIWVGTRNNGVVKIMPNKQKIHINTNNGLSASLVMCIDEDKNGNILVGTNEGGLNIIEKDKVTKVFDENAGLASNVVFNTYNDQNNITWLAVNGELCAIKDNKITHFTLANGLIDDSPYDIIEDNSGNLWMPCSKGIMKIKKAELLNIINKTADNFSCKLYNSNDGMYQAECNPTSQSLFATDGSLLFPTIEGVAKIHPYYLTVNKYIPPVIIENLIIDGENFPIASITKIPSGKKRFTFEYTALSLHEPERVRFKYRLQGFDNNWVEAGNSRSISYTNLSPGNYVFQVIACNNDGIWNEKGESMILNIRPKFVQTKSFYAILSLIAFLLIYSFYQFRLIQLKKQRKLLEQKVHIRTAELNAKNQELEEQKAETLAQSEKLKEQKTELEKANTAKDKMFSVIAHDLRSPMGNFNLN